MASIRTLASLVLSTLLLVCLARLSECADDAETISEDGSLDAKRWDSGEFLKEGEEERKEEEEEGKEEEEEEPDGELAIREAYRRLFVRQEELSNEQVLELLQVFEPHYELFSDYLCDEDFSKLSQFNVPTSAFCQDGEKVKLLNKMLAISNGNYDSLHDYLQNAFDKQLKFCEEELQKTGDSFRMDYPNDWHSIVAVHAVIGTIPMQPEATLINRAICQLVKDLFPTDKQSQPMLQDRAQVMAMMTREACQQFSSSLGPRLEVALKISPNFMQDERENLDRWLTYQNMCNQVAAPTFVIDFDCTLDEPDAKGKRKLGDFLAASSPHERDTSKTLNH